MRRVALAVTGAAVALCALAPAAAATRYHDRIDLIGHFLFVDAGYHGGSTITVTTDRRAAIISSDRALDASGCKQIGPRSGRCVDVRHTELNFESDDDTLLASDSPVRMVAYGYGGDDRLEGSAFSDKLIGYDGRDVLAGGRGMDRLSGGDGGDRIRGGGGSDDVYGGTGADRLASGRGRDRIFANDGERDELIDCGPGTSDFARIDEVDPRPRHCESVERVPTPDSGTARAR